MQFGPKILDSLAVYREAREAGKGPASVVQQVVNEVGVSPNEARYAVALGCGLVTGARISELDADTMATWLTDAEVEETDLEQRREAWMQIHHRQMPDREEWPS